MSDTQRCCEYQQHMTNIIKDYCWLSHRFRYCPFCGKDQREQERPQTVSVKD